MRTFTPIALSLLCLSSVARAQPLEIKAGEPFPSITLPALEDGSPRSILDYRGRKVILHVFASW